MTSGFVDDEKGCAISIESFEEIQEWESRGRIETQPIRAIGLLLALAMVPITPIATAVAWAVQRSRTQRTGTDPQPTPAGGPMTGSH